MQDDIEGVVLDKTEEKEKIVRYNVFIGKDFTKKETDIIISNIEQGHNYNANTGYYESVYMINLEEGKKEKGFGITTFIGKNLTEDEQDKIHLAIDYSYSPDTGIFTVKQKFNF